MTAADENSPDTRIGLTPLCHRQWIQSIIVVFLTNYTDWCPRYDEFRRRYANSLCVARLERALPPEEFTDELIKITGTKDLTETARNQHIDVWQEASQRHPGIGGSPRELLEVLTGFVEICFPRTFSEWFDLAQHACDLAGGIDVIQAIMESVIHNMQPSIRSGFVALNIEHMSRHDPTNAFAHCMTWLQRYLAWTELAMPTQAEVDDFAALNGISVSADNEPQRRLMQTMFFSHEVYKGTRRERAIRENPFAFLIRHKLSCLSSDDSLQPQINAKGRLTGLRWIDSERRPESRPVNSENADRKGAKGLTFDAGISTHRRLNHDGKVTDGDRQQVREAIEEHRSRNNSQTPGATALRKLLKGHHVCNGKLQLILDEMRDAGKYDIPRRACRKDPSVTH